MIENGVAKYLIAKGTVSNSFPVDNKGVVYCCCTYCKFYSKSYNICKLTDEIILYADKFVGAKCPLDVEEE